MHISSLLASFATAIPVAVAQCQTDWARSGVPGAMEPIFSTTTWDPDGTGPRPEHAVVGGLFTYAGNVLANGIAMHDPNGSTWTAFGNGFGTPFGQGVVYAMAVLANGELVAAGDFSSSGSTTVLNIARWSAGAWHPLGQGTDGPVRALTVLPNGTLIAGGNFSTAGGVPASCLAAWNGATWAPVGAGIFGAPDSYWVSSLVTLNTGEVIVGGSFSFAGGLPANGIAKWNGTTWSTFGNGTSDEVRGIAAAPNGDLFVGGTFTTIGGVPADRLARWSNNTWNALGTGPGFVINTIQVRSGGQLLVGGLANGNVGPVAAWNGSTWSSVSDAPTGANSTVQSISALSSGLSVVGGSFATAWSRNLVYVDQSLNWRLPSEAFDGPVHSILKRPDGTIVVAGDFHLAGGVRASNVAEFNGTSWSALASGTNAPILDLARFPNGDLVAVGPFTSAGGVPVNGVARWSGTAWSSLGWPQALWPETVAVSSSGEVFVGGIGNTVWRGNGSTWSAMPPLAPPPRYPAEVYHLGFANGRLIATGYLPNGVVEWNGSTWSPLGGAALTDLTRGFEIGPNDDVYVGTSTFGGSIARWNGSSWGAVGAGPSSPRAVTALAVAADGSLVAQGTFPSGPLPVARLTRWNGVSWQSMGGDLMTASGLPLGSVSTIAGLSTGDVVAGGSFFAIGDRVSAFCGRWSTNCPARLLSYGAACAGSELAATSSPWLGRPFTSTATGMPISLAVAVLGFGGLAVPLSSILPPSLPGCSLLVTLDVLTAHVPQSGRVDVSLPLPSERALVGVSFRQQVVGLSLDPQGYIIGAISTNGLLATIGSY